MIIVLYQHRRLVIPTNRRRGALIRVWGFSSHDIILLPPQQALFFLSPGLNFQNIATTASDISAASSISLDTDRWTIPEALA